MDQGGSAAGAEESRPFFFLHVEKTGGNTVNSYFYSFLPFDTIYPPLPQLTLDGEDFARARAALGRLRYLHGHVVRDLTAELPMDRMRLITFVREPVSLVASYYLYHRYSPALAHHEAARSLRIDEFLRRVPGYLPDRQARTIANAFGIPIASDHPMDAARLAAVLALVEERFDFVGTTDLMEESLSLLAEHFSLPFFPPARENASSAHKAEQEECRAIVRQEEFLSQLSGDLALYRAAQGQLERHRRASRLRRAESMLLRGGRPGAPRPEVLARREELELAFVDGWLPQRWIRHPDGRPPVNYWWTHGRSARLLAHSPRGRPCRVELGILNTAGFPPQAIQVFGNGQPLATECRGAGPGAGPGTVLGFTVPEALFRAGAGFAEIEIRGERAVSPPEAPHLPPRSVAVRSFAVMPADP